MLYLIWVILSILTSTFNFIGVKTPIYLGSTIPGLKPEVNHVPKQNISFRLLAYRFLFDQPAPIRQLSDGRAGRSFLCTKEKGELQFAPTIMRIFTPYTFRVTRYVFYTLYSSQLLIFNDSIVVLDKASNKRMAT